jgi:hypothetical protein
MHITLVSHLLILECLKPILDKINEEELIKKVFFKNKFIDTNKI